MGYVPSDYGKELYGSRDLNKREVEVLCYRGCTGHCLDHDCISIHAVNAQMC